MKAIRASAYHALFQRGHGDAGETVLVHGASGGVGIGAVQLARARGMTVFGTAGTAEGRRLVLEQGAHHALDHTAPDYLDELLRLTGGKGVNVVLEMLANVNLAKDLDIVAMHGRIVVIGNRGTIAINPRGAMNKNAAIIGVALFHASPAQLAGIHAALVEGLGHGTLRSGAGVPAITSAQAVGRAVRALGARRVAIVSPYSDAVNERAARYFKAKHGLETVALEGFGATDAYAIGKLGPQNARDAFARVDRPEIEAFVVPGGNFPTMSSVAAWEREFKKPVVTTNQASFWAMLRALKSSDRLPAFGRLLAEVPAEAA